MNDRTPPPLRATPPRPMAALGHRASSQWSALVVQKLRPTQGQPDALWSFRTRKDQWVCPFCLSTVSKRPGRTIEDSLALHLEGCQKFAGGRGQPKTYPEVGEAFAVAELAAALETEAIWQVSDPEGAWFCPSCLGRQPAIRLRTSVDSFLVEAVRRHLAVCAPYHQGFVHSLAEVQAARSQAAHVAGLAQWVHQQLAFETWRHATAEGAWLCPCCAQPQAQIRMAPAEAWTVAPTAIAHHLATCPAYDPRQLRLHDEATMRGYGGLPQPYPGITPTRLALSQARVALPVGQKTPLSQKITQVASSTQLTAIALPSLHGRGTMNSPLPFPAAEAAVPSATPHHERVLDWMDSADRDQAAEHAANLAHQREDVAGARALQQSILGPLPVVPGYTFAVRCEACNDITGDFYTFVRLANGDLAFALGDVSGHGVRAGLVMSMAKKTFEIYAVQGGGPADILAKVNDALADDLAGKLFVSMIVGVLSPSRQAITWARAGHPPVLHFNPRTRVSGEIAPRGMVVGMRGGQIFRQSLEEQAQKVAPGDVFLLYTDGIVEAVNLQGEEFGQERLVEVVRRHAGDGPESMCEHLMDLMRHFRGPKPMADDTTLLAFAVT